ncbi:MAG TPA: hypothetical protein VHA73_13945 [Acidimicrobiales bacterium]|jgi:hypothetical protein|nr:hypothetical protein [Acidimicrobiales bacterium]
MIFDSITNRGEFFSDHYLDALIGNDLAGLRKRWDDEEGRGQSTARTRVRSLAAEFYRAKTQVVEGTAAAHDDNLRELHDRVLEALGFGPKRQSIEPVRGGVETLTFEVAHAEATPTGLLLVALDLGFTTTLDAALDPDAAGRVLSPVLSDGKVLRKDRLSTLPVSDVVAALFAVDEPPRYVLLLAGVVVVLADRAKWGEGRFLAVDLDLALSRHDTKAKGELETVAALFSADALVPVDGTSVLDGLVSSSQKHAVGVSKDLRDGIRQSIELLANEVIQQRLAANRAVYNVPHLATDLTRESLRFLYRLLFLLYAETRPELGILPLDHPEYVQGYGLDRLRELALTKLTSDKARNGSHLHESLNLLFRLVNDGYHAVHAEQAMLTDLPGEMSETEGLRFEPLHSTLFDPAATPLLDGVRLRNDCLQQVLALLLLSKERKGRERGFVSYAQLGINQLGAVYEGLMAYSGFFADEDLYEVAKGGDPDKGTWMVPVAQADAYDDDVFVRRDDPQTGRQTRVRHPKGSFVFRLSGRDRQRSASYYTPEVLTQCVVKHSLAELLDQDGETTPAERILGLTVCEPALGSGAFVNEAINQLAAEYLRRRQDELAELIDPDQYTAELQKVKAHLALHQCYGVDLNATAVELAEVSLWLNAMHPGLQAPWFGLHLRRGNSLIGGRRAVYQRAQLAKSEWLKRPPTPRPLGAEPLADGEIHHFLLPAHGWAAVGDAKEAKELRSDDAKALRDWRKAVTNPPSKRDADRLVALARRAEDLWGRAQQVLERAEADLRRPIQIWGATQSASSSPLSRAALETLLQDPESALGRLRLVMNAWCALWFWPIVGRDGAERPVPPSFSEWLDTIEAILGVDDAHKPPGQLNLFDDFEAMLQRDRQLTLEFGSRPIPDVLASHPWLLEAQVIAEREGFFHWELEFAPVFERGGFDLQVGNPPWVRLDWKDDITLAEFDPWFGLTDKAPEARRRERRADVLSDGPAEGVYLREVGDSAGLTANLGSAVERPVLSGIRTNLYMVFMDTVWRHASAAGVSGLLHPESHFTDPKGGPLRRGAYHRLRRHWQFLNGLFLFDDINHKTIFGVHIYGPQQHAEFLQMSYLQSPDMVDGSLEHDGSGEVPGIQYPSGGWDLRPHRARVVTVDEPVLASWALLFDEPGTPADEARLLRPVTTADLEALVVLANQPTRLADHKYHWTPGFNETNAKTDGTIIWETKIPDSWDEVILQGPHFTVATPFAKQPNEHCKHNQDYSAWDLETLPERVIPRTNYQRTCDRDTYESRIDHWNGRPSTDYWRHVHREMTQPGLERSVQGAVLAPGPLHIHACLTYGFDDQASLVRFAGLMSSIPIDYLFKASGAGHVAEHQLKRVPLPNRSAYDAALASRTLRLNCLTADYAPLWEELYDPTWNDDAWTDPTSMRPPLGDVGPRWTMATPLRTDYDRRMALVEIDALAALMLGLTAEQLCAMYRTQFAVLRKYEYGMVFDAQGRKIAKDHQTAGVNQQKGDYERVQAFIAGDDVDVAPYEPPFTRPDREKEMTQAYEVFQRRYGGGSAAASS